MAAWERCALSNSEHVGGLNSATSFPLLWSIVIPAYRRAKTPEFKKY
jgi:hypothetical protein